MINKVGRFIPDGYKPFRGSKAYVNDEYNLLSEIISTNTNKLVGSISEVFDLLKISDGMCLSFHHHLRNGDLVFNLVLEEIKKRNLKNMTLAPSAIFPVNDILSELIENGNVTNIYTNYLNGKVADMIAQGKLQGLLIMDTHGGRARAIMTGELKIDVCFAAASAADKDGNANGVEGINNCGPLGYIIPDCKYARHKVVITDCLLDNLCFHEIEGKYIDYVVTIDNIGDSQKIVSGTTEITKNPIGLKIAKLAADLLDELGYIKDGFGMQTGAGGTSLAVAAEVKKIMKEKNIRAGFASGGITGYYVEMLEENMIDALYDVQSFDLEAVNSYKVNKNHHGMSSSKYANPFDPEVVVNNLDFVILGATEIDLDFNVNVTTTSLGNIIGGSGGHADAAHGAKITIITTNLIKSRLPVVKRKVQTITTPGEDVDVLVTEFGIAINPKRKDLLEKLENSQLPIMDIKSLLDIAHKITGEPKEIERKTKIVGLVRYRDGTIIDTLYGY
ncbi:MAG TPA: citrate lyase subunit alpha [Acholeplasmataceae bacterium]|nr:citrate lyase subunit alpha [Acholeplasmataceae bacterium]